MPSLEPQVVLPVDRELPVFSHLFDSQWVWRAFCAQWGTPKETPKQLRVQHLQYDPGKWVRASYVTEWQGMARSVDNQFAVELVKGGTERWFRFPDDPYLPGLRPAVSVLEATELIKKYVGAGPRSLQIDLMRYRPASRAVLWHSTNWQGGGGEEPLFVRVMSPKRVPRLLMGTKLAESSDFIIPRIVGCWAEGGVIWSDSIRGETLRTLVRKGKPPDPHLVLDHLVPLWSGYLPPGAVPLDLLAAFRMTERLMSHLLRDEEAGQALQQVVDTLGPFAESWRPSALAHNDFYDAQMLLTPSGRLALVDLDQTGPGDPMLDVGNLLAHLNTMAHFGVAPEACADYRRRLRSSALDRFGWAQQDLDLREAFALFRLTSNYVRRLRSNWSKRVEDGLSLVLQVLNRSP